MASGEMSGACEDSGDYSDARRAKSVRAIDYRECSEGRFKRD